MGQIRPEAWDHRPGPKAGFGPHDAGVACVTRVGHAVTAFMAIAVSRPVVASQQLNYGKVLITSTRGVGVPHRTWCGG
jgi:hypothetical protein